MKIEIRRDDLLAALNKGGVAALSEYAQSDTTNVGLYLKAVKIVVNKTSVSFESANELMCAKYVLAIKDDNVKVSEEGSSMVPAKELIEWVKIQSSDALITMALKKHDKPEIVGSVDSDDGIRKLGNLHLLSKSKQVGVKWSLDSFDPSTSKSPDYSQNGEKVFTVNSASFLQGLSKVLPLGEGKSDDKDNIFCNILVREYNKKLYLMATNQHQCGIYNVDDKQVTNLKAGFRFLIPTVLLNASIKTMDEAGEISAHYNDATKKVFLSQNGLDMRFGVSEKIDKFSPMERILAIKFKDAATIAKDDFVKVLTNASMVNLSAVLFNFSTGKNLLEIMAVSENKPMVTVKTNVVAKMDFKVLWGSQELLKVLKIFESKELEIKVPENHFKSMLVAGKEDSNFTYFSLAYDMSDNYSKYFNDK